MTATEQGFLRAICAEPAEDVHRLVFADWLDDHQQPERAEFIRVQVEIASDPRTEHAKSDFSLSAGCTCSLCKLRRRERELLDNGIGSSPRRANWMLWEKPCRAGYCLNIYDGKPLDTGVAITFSRGFVSRIRCKLEDWIGIWCERCKGEKGKVNPTGGFREFSGSYPKWELCPACQGTGRVNAHGRAIVKQQPVEYVEAVGMQPYTTSEKLWGWLRQSSSSYAVWPTYLPPEVYDLLPEPDHIKPPVGLWESEARANAALSTALLRLAGSPALASASPPPS